MTSARFEIPNANSPERGRIVGRWLTGEHYAAPVSVLDPLGVTDHPRDGWVAVCGTGCTVRVRASRRAAIRALLDCTDCLNRSAA